MKEQEYFSSRWGLVLAALGMAVGTGNIWRFPRVAAQNGGGAFLIAWIVALLLWSIPLLIVEFAIGRKTRLGTAGAFGQLIGKRWNWMGMFLGGCTCLIMFYYAVVSGWCVRYFVTGVISGMSGMDIEDYWNRFTGSLQPVGFQLISLVICGGVVMFGVVKGIERISKFLIPGLFLLLLIAAGRAITLPGSAEGLRFLFRPEWAHLADHRVWLEALSQSAWSVGAGWGLIITYAVYMRRNEDIVLNSCLTGFGNNSASLLAGIAVLCTVFALLPMADAMTVVEAGNEGLSFIWIPRLFDMMPGGRFFMALFFLALSCAAFSSLIALIELAARMLMDLGLERRGAVILVLVVAFLLGIPSARNMQIFKNQDWVWGVGLLVSGMFTAFAAIKYGARKFRRELINVPGNDINLGRWFDYLICYIIPIEFVVLIGWWSYKAIKEYDPEGWWNPFRTFSLGTCVFQWAILIAFLMVVNHWVMKRIASRGEAR